MRISRILTLSALLTASTLMQAGNTKTTVKQVTDSVAIADDVDYIISDATPFGTTGKVNITNTEHAVVIIQKIRPSQVISKILRGHVFINGQQAVNGTNCQVRMYNRGAIIFPYAKTLKPLTCYTEENYGGSSYNGYTEGHDGSGFMKSLSNAQLNNKIQSFKLKRGYMVTFAVGTGGWGYSRCFIADQEDLEIPVMPNPFKGTISSYRLFQWYNASKAGVHDTSAAANAALGTTSCFDWGQGNASLLPDVEWVSHHIYEDWPSAGTCGSVTGTCHMKTNNEPGNSADDHPQDVETVLNNWENLMRTGLRLCSESSHDGSMGHLKTFMEEIDKRGWRCDIVDLHGYWDGQWNNLDWYISEYGKGRPVWFSEWLWGASWGGNGAFANGRQNDDATYNGTKPILDKLNAHSKVERYYYWNSEQWYTKIWRDNQLTKLGQYYATMDVPLAYNAANEFVPVIVTKTPGTPTVAYNKKKGVATIEWIDPNGDMLTRITIQRKNPGSSTWKNVGTVEPKDRNSRNGVTYTYNDTISEAGLYSYRIQVTGVDKKNYNSDDASVTISASNSVGMLGYGNLAIANSDVIETDFDVRHDAEGAEVTPAVFTGLVSNKNTANGLSNQVVSITKNLFKFRLNPWTLKTPAAIDKTENVDFMLLPFGTYDFAEEGQLVVAKFGNVKGDTLNVQFDTPFPEGTTPVVIIQNNSTNLTYAPVVARAWDITNEGFKVVLTRQAGVSGTLYANNVNYLAALPGTYKVGDGKLLTVYRDAETPVGGTTYVAVPLNDAEGQPLHLVDPVVLAAPQTFNYAATCVFRQNSLVAEDYTVGETTYSATTGVRVRRQNDETTTVTDKNDKKLNGDYMGFVILSTDLHATGDEPGIFNDPTALSHPMAESFTVSSHAGMLQSNDSRARAYNMNGQQVPMGQRLPSGIYVVTNGTQRVKVTVK